MSVGYADTVGIMLLNEVADLGAQVDVTSSTVEDHSQQLGELLVMLHMIQNMMGTQQEMVMGLMEWEHQLAIQEVEINH